jgi:hypothetical protein
MVLEFLVMIPSNKESLSNFHEFWREEVHSKKYSKKLKTDA